MSDLTNAAFRRVGTAVGTPNVQGDTQRHLSDADANAENMLDYARRVQGLSVKAAAARCGIAEARMQRLVDGHSSPIAIEQSAIRKAFALPEALQAEAADEANKRKWRSRF
jgi:hypothetical protein